MAKKTRKDARRKNEDETQLKSWTDGIPLSPAWWVPVFVTFLVVGLVWLVVYYFTGAQYPIPGITHWNLVIGIVFMLVGFIMTLRWR